MDPTEEYLIQKHIIEGLSARSIAKELGCSHTKIIKRMKKYGITSITNPLYNQYGRKNSYNDDYFQEINTPDKAYWLGFIWADGYIYESSKQRRLRITLGIKDKCHLQKFKESLEGDMDIKHDLVDSFGSIRECCYIDVNCSRLCDDLIKHGMTHYKESRKELPSISNELIPHFLRGLIDADGSIQILKTNYKEKIYETLTISFVGNNELLIAIRSYLNDLGILFTPKSLIALKGTFSLRLYKREYVLSLLDTIYPTGSYMLMDRKKEIYSSFLCKR